MGGKKEEIDKLWRKVERQLEVIRRKEEKETRERNLARGYLRCWRGEGEVDQFFLLRGNMGRELDMYCNSEISQLEMLCINVKLFLSQTNKARKLYLFCQDRFESECHR